MTAKPAKRTRLRDDIWYGQITCEVVPECKQPAAGMLETEDGRLPCCDEHGSAAGVGGGALTRWHEMVSEGLTYTYGPIDDDDDDEDHASE